MNDIEESRSVMDENEVLSARLEKAEDSVREYEKEVKALKEQITALQSAAGASVCHSLAHFICSFLLTCSIPIRCMYVAYRLIASRCVVPSAQPLRLPFPVVRTTVEAATRFSQLRNGCLRWLHPHHCPAHQSVTLVGYLRNRNPRWTSLPLAPPQTCKLRCVQTASLCSSLCTAEPCSLLGIFIVFSRAVVQCLLSINLTSVSFTAGGPSPRSAGQRPTSQRRAAKCGEGVQVWPCSERKELQGRAGRQSRAVSRQAGHRHAIRTAVVVVIAVYWFPDAGVWEIDERRDSIVAHEALNSPSIRQHITIRITIRFPGAIASAPEPQPAGHRCAQARVV